MAPPAATAPTGRRRAAAAAQAAGSAASQGSKCVSSTAAAPSAGAQRAASKPADTPDNLSAVAACHALLDTLHAPATKHAAANAPGPSLKQLEDLHAAAAAALTAVPAGSATATQLASRLLQTASGAITPPSGGDADVSTPSSASSSAAAAVAIRICHLAQDAACAPAGGAGDAGAPAASRQQQRDAQLLQYGAARRMLLAGHAAHALRHALRLHACLPRQHPHSNGGSPSRDARPDAARARDQGAPCAGRAAGGPGREDVEWEEEERGQQQAEELGQAVCTHLLVCLSELAPDAAGGGGEGGGAACYRALAAEVVRAVQPRLLDASRGAMPAGWAKHAETAFKCLYKVLTRAARTAAEGAAAECGGAVALLRDAWRAFYLAAGPVQQRPKLPQYVTRILADLARPPATGKNATGAAAAAAAACSTMALGVLVACVAQQACSFAQDGMGDSGGGGGCGCGSLGGGAACVWQACAEAAVKAVWDAPAVLEQLCTAGPSAELSTATTTATASHLPRVVAVLLSPDGPASPAPCAAPLALALLLRHAASRDDHNGDEGSEGGHGDEAVSAACGALLPAVEEVAAGLGPAAVVESKRAAPGCGRRAEGAGGERHALWVAWLGLRYLHEAAAPFVLAEEAHAGGTAGGSLHAWLGGGMRGGAGGPAASGRRGVEEEEEEEEGAGVEAVARALLLGPGLARRAVAAWGGDGGPLLGMDAAQAQQLSASCLVCGTHLATRLLLLPPPPQQQQHGGAGGRAAGARVAAGGPAGRGGRPATLELLRAAGREAARLIRRLVPPSARWGVEAGRDSELQQQQEQENEEGEQEDEDGGGEEGTRAKEELLQWCASHFAALGKQTAKVPEGQDAAACALASASLQDLAWQAGAALLRLSSSRLGRSCACPGGLERGGGASRARAEGGEEQRGAAAEEEAVRGLAQQLERRARAACAAWAAAGEHARTAACAAESVALVLRLMADHPGAVALPTKLVQLHATSRLQALAMQAPPQRSPAHAAVGAAAGKAAAAPARGRTGQRRPAGGGASAAAQPPPSRAGRQAAGGSGASSAQATEERAAAGGGACGLLVQHLVASFSGRPGSDEGDDGGQLQGAAGVVEAARPLQLLDVVAQEEVAQYQRAAQRGLGDGEPGATARLCRSSVLAVIECCLDATRQRPLLASTHDRLVLLSASVASGSASPSSPPLSAEDEDDGGGEDAAPEASASSPPAAAATSLDATCSDAAEEACVRLLDRCHTLLLAHEPQDAALLALLPELLLNSHAAATHAAARALRCAARAVSCAPADGPSVSTPRRGEVGGGAQGGASSDAMDVDGPASASDGVAGAAWEAYDAWLGVCVDAAEALAAALQRERADEASRRVLPRPELATQQLLQVWQICQLQDDVAAMASLERCLRALSLRACQRRLGATWAGLAACARPQLGCTLWALQPAAPERDADGRSGGGTLADAMEVVGSCPPAVQALLSWTPRRRDDASAHDCSSAPGQRGAPPQASWPHGRQAAVDVIAHCAWAAAIDPSASAANAAATRAGDSGGGGGGSASKHAGVLWLLLRVQLLHSAASAYSAWGNTPQAWCCSQQALALTSALHAGRAPPGEATNGGSLGVSGGDGASVGRAAAVGAAGVGPVPAYFTCLCASLQLASLVQAAEACEALGQSDEALCLLRECESLAGALRSHSARCLAAQRLAHLLHRRGEPREAEAALRRSLQALQMCRPTPRASESAALQRAPQPAEPTPPLHLRLLASTAAQLACTLQRPDLLSASSPQHDPSSCVFTWLLPPGHRTPHPALTPQQALELSLAVLPSAASDPHSAAGPAVATQLAATALLHLAELSLDPAACVGLTSSPQPSAPPAASEEQAPGAAGKGGRRRGKPARDPPPPQPAAAAPLPGPARGDAAVTERRAQRRRWLAAAERLLLTWIPSAPPGAEAGGAGRGGGGEALTVEAAEAAGTTTCCWAPGQLAACARPDLAAQLLLARVSAALEEAVTPAAEAAQGEAAEGEGGQLLAVVGLGGGFAPVVRRGWEGEVSQEEEEEDGKDEGASASLTRGLQALSLGGVGAAQGPGRRHAGRGGVAPVDRAAAVAAPRKGRARGGGPAATVRAGEAVEEQEEELKERADGLLRAAAAAALLSWPRPGAFRRACGALLALCAARGLPHAAAAALHMGLGAWPERQRLAAGPAWAASRARCHGQQGDDGDGSSAPPEARRSSGAKQGRAGRGGATAGAAGCEEDGGEECAWLCSSHRALVQGLPHGRGGGARRLESASQAWLRATLRRVPGGPAVACVSARAPPLLLHLLRRPLASYSPPLIVTCHVAAGCERPPLVMVLNGPPAAAPAPAATVRCGGEEEAAAAGLLAELSAVLSDSARSMAQPAAELQSPERKAAWWKARVELDRRMAQLQALMQDRWLGPWGWLPLAPLPSGARQRHQPAADALACLITDELATAHPPDIADAIDRRQQLALLQELLLLLLAHAPRLLPAADAPAAKPPPPHSAVGDLLRVLLPPPCARGEGGADDAAAAALRQHVHAAVAGAARASALNVPGEARPAAAASGSAEADSALAPAPAGGAVEVTRRDAPAAPAPVEEAGDAVPAAAPAGRRRAPTSRLKAISGAAAAASQVELLPPPPALAGRAGRRPAGRAGAAAAAAAAAAAPTATSSKAAAAAPLHRGGGGSTQAALPSDPPAASEPPQPRQAEAAEPLLLVLSDHLHALPWESIPCLRQPPAPDGPSASPTGPSQQQQQQQLAEGGVPRVFRVPSLAFAAAAAAAAGAEGGGEEGVRPEAAAPAAALVELSRSYYVLNPAGDLRDTQACFERWFADRLRWTGVAGRAPAAGDMLCALRHQDLLVYMGHGSGEHLLPPPSPPALPCGDAGEGGGGRWRAAGLLMGCSSGRVRTHGAYPPSGALLTYLMAGCPSVVANLWDVTDKDIDRFSLALLQRWMHGSAAPPLDGAEAGAEEPPLARAGAAAARRGGRGAARAGEVEPAARAPREVGAAGGSEQDEGVCVSGAVASSRGQCRLPSLIGAAPVVYGLPSVVRWLASTNA